MTSDAALVAHAKEGDLDARASLFRRHSRLALDIALRLTRNRTEAEEVAQEAFVEALACLAGLREGASFRRWLISIVTHRACFFIRRQQRVRRLGLLQPTAIDFEELSGPHLSPEQLADANRLRAHIAALPAKQRTAMIMRYIEGRNLEEIALLAHCSMASVKRYLVAGEKKLRESLS